MGEARESMATDMLTCFYASLGTKGVVAGNG